MMLFSVRNPGFGGVMRGSPARLLAAAGLKAAIIAEPIRAAVARASTPASEYVRVREATA